MHSKFKLAISYLVDGDYYNGFYHFGEYLKSLPHDKEETKIENLKKLVNEKTLDIMKIIRGILEENIESDTAVKIIELFWALKPVETTIKLLEVLESNQEKENYKIAILYFFRNFNIYRVVNGVKQTSIKNFITVSLIKMIKNKSENDNLRKKAIYAFENLLLAPHPVEKETIELLNNIYDDETGNTIVRNAAENILRMNPITKIKKSKK
jgi:hypothetical protein